MNPGDYYYFCILIRAIWAKSFPEINLSESITDYPQKLTGLVSDIENQTIGRLENRKSPVTERTLRSYTDSVISNVQPSHKPNTKTLEILSRYAMGIPKIEGQKLEKWIRSEKYKEGKYWEKFKSIIGSPEVTIPIKSNNKIFCFSRWEGLAGALTIGIFLFFFLLSQVCSFHQFIENQNWHGVHYFSKKLKMGNDCSPMDSFRNLMSALKRSPKSKNSGYPCFTYQGEWKLDSDSLYWMKIPYQNGDLFYVSKAVHLYTWCLEDSIGQRLDGIEVLSGEVRYCEKENCENWEDMLLVGEIYSLFRDEIKISSKGEPVKRTGYRMGRYSPMRIASEEHQSKLDIAKLFLDNLNVTNCDSVLVSRNNSDFGKGLKIGFTCDYYHPVAGLQNYNKWLVLVEEW